MAKIWAVYDGDVPTLGGPWARLPVEDAIDLFELQQKHFVSGPQRTPRFGDSNVDLTILGYKQIVVEIGKNEKRSENWKPGFYRSPVTPGEGFSRLVKRVFVNALGNAYVRRVQIEPTNDPQGFETQKITVVIPRGAMRKLKGDALIDALIGMQELLRDMGSNRVPIVEYATEAELRQHERLES